MFSKLKGQEGSIIDLTILRKTSQYSSQEYCCNFACEPTNRLHKNKSYAETTYDEFQISLNNLKKTYTHPCRRFEKQWRCIYG